VQLLQKKQPMAKLFQGEQHKIGLMGELPMGEPPLGEPPWGSGAEQGCPNMGGTGWTCPKQELEESCGSRSTAYEECSGPWRA
jgi:hypothetical protein